MLRITVNARFELFVRLNSPKSSDSFESAEADDQEVRIGRALAYETRSAAPMDCIQAM